MPRGETSQCATPARPVERPWGAIPIGKIGPSRLALSCSIPLALAIVVILVTAQTSKLGNADLPWVASWAVAFWICGWIIQWFAQCVAVWWLGLTQGDLTIKLIGVEPHATDWTAVQTLWVSFASLAALILGGAFWWWADGGFGIPVWNRAQPVSPLSSQVEVLSVSETWRLGAWLCWAQAICQMFPLPHTTGRRILGALTSLCAWRLDAQRQAAVYRNCLLVLALATMVVAVVLVIDGGRLARIRWPFFVLLAMMLWVSSKSSDLMETILAFQNASRHQEGEFADDDDDRLEAVMQNDAPRPGVFGRVRRAVQARRHHRRVQHAMARERREAVDAEHLDEILRRLHKEGPSSLSAEDRLILDRVSKSLRKHRDDEHDR
ncbi:MAG: hypothetical protein MI861_26140, partial [Pirellulales bacterium]|nr:hypothetical protein [Pirellulales bacterium]